MNGYYNQVAAVLKQYGFFVSRQKGSHQTWTNGAIAVTVSTNCASRFTANAIMKQAGLSERF
ncbi:type II toxin-antitoxin system HicA family toxin [Acidovorax sp. SUPP2522]|uniref:type II toxin-antitoxin system HicA family toxin n=1 Tax=Acidovorax sp. SUPP2522 TaxID=511900 RepID=UPI0032EA1E7D